MVPRSPVKKERGLRPFPRRVTGMEGPKTTASTLVTTNPSETCSVSSIMRSSFTTLLRDSEFHDPIWNMYYIKEDVNGLVSIV